MLLQLDTFHWGGDGDWVTFYSKGSEALAVTAAPGNIALDIDILLHSPDGTDSVTDNAAAGVAETVNITSSQEGTYYARVKLADEQPQN